MEGFTEHIYDLCDLSLTLLEPLHSFYSSISSNLHVWLQN